MSTSSKCKFSAALSLGFRYFLKGRENNGKQEPHTVMNKEDLGFFRG